LNFIFITELFFCFTISRVEKVNLTEFCLVEFNDSVNYFKIIMSLIPYFCCVIDRNIDFEFVYVQLLKIHKSIICLTYYFNFLISL